MKKFLLIFSAFVLVCPNVARGAVTIKKAAPVAAKKTSAMDSTGSMIPTVLNLVSAVKDLSAKTKALTEECIPTAAEITFVNNMVQEWAKTGTSTADEAIKSLGMQRCPAGTSYASQIGMYGNDMDDAICTDYFTGDGNKDMVWDQYPMASSATYCTDGSDVCGNSQKKTVSNIYNVFNLIDFSELDYTKSEFTMASQLITKIEKCSDAKLSKAKRAMWHEFLINTISNVGQPTNTGAIMQSVGTITESGLGGGLQSLSGIATQFLNK